MTRRKDIAVELEEISPKLAQLEAVNPYRVPAGYFETLADSIMFRIRAENELSATEEIESMSPLLAGLKKSMPYSVPAGYFEQLSPAALTKKEERATGRVISLNARRIFRYAAAAVTVGVIVVAVIFFGKDSRDETSSMALNKDTATEQQVLDNIANISDSEIAAFVEGGSVIFGLEPAAPAADFAAEDLSLLLAEVSDQELERYIEQINPTAEKFN